MVWGKQFYSRNWVKTGEHTALSCQVCRQGTDDQEHTLLECRAPAMTQLRAEDFKDLTRIIEEQAPESAQQYLIQGVKWAQTTDDEAGQERVNRLAFLLGRPTKMFLEQLAHDNPVPSVGHASAQKTIEAIWDR